jgi:phosphatidylglycerophosphate synthase
MADLDNRRPLKTRSAVWAGRLAARLGKAGVSPNGISAVSVGFAALGGALFMLSGTAEGWGRAVGLILAVVCVQLRLLCNLLDGMVAVEQGLATPTGPIWNELPDRFADLFFLVGAGYGAQAAGFQVAGALGWLCAALAILTAYVRELGRGLGQPADFGGPMAKPQRMFVLTLAGLIGAVEPLWGWKGQTVLIGLGVIAAGALITVWRRARRLGQALQKTARD